MIGRESKSRGLQVTTEELDILYALACRDAARETGLPLSTFPTACPYSLDTLRDPDAMPD